MIYSVERGDILCQCSCDILALLRLASIAHRVARELARVSDPLTEKGKLTSSHVEVAFASMRHNAIVKVVPTVERHSHLSQLLSLWFCSTISQVRLDP